MNSMQLWVVFRLARLNDIVEWKNNYVDKIKSNYSNTLNLPDKMISGL